MILVVGGSGVLGRQVVRQLLDRGEQVRVMTRQPANAHDLAAAGAEVVRGDLIDPASVSRACAGAGQVVASAHSLLGRGRYRSEAVDDAGNRGLIDAAARAGVAYLVFVSIMGVRPDHPVDFFRTKFRVEQYLKGSGLSSTILRPSAFMEVHAHALNGKGILERGRTTLIGKGSKLRNFVAAPDVAQFVDLALREPALHGRTLEVGGPGNYTNNQVAALYGRAAGVRPKVRHVPAGAARVASAVLKPFHPGISRVMFMQSLPNDAYSETFDPASLLAEFSVELTPLPEFIAARVAEARGGGRA